MKAAEQIRALDKALEKRLGAAVYPAARRELALDIHQALADAASSIAGLQLGVDRLIDEALPF